MRIVLLGAPGAGKGTQADFIATEYGCEHISTGDIFRSNLRDKTELGLLAESYMNKGALVPDGVVVDMVRDRLRDIAGGFLMDGFPRTLPQASALEDILRVMEKPLDAVLLLDIDEEVLVKRLTSRRTCRKCGKIWNLAAVESDADCPECGGALYLRDDDAEEVIRNRLDVYCEQTLPLADWYEKKGLLRRVDAVGSPAEVFGRVRMALSR
ncbi:MAG: adenylate kinase [Synergistaceae bacterium]|nr:adenylate kinase [Synergistaceae bacterium]